jgi:hypothetical protein
MDVSPPPFPRCKNWDPDCSRVVSSGPAGLLLYNSIPPAMLVVDLFAPPSARPLHLVPIWSLWALPRDPSPSYSFFSLGSDCYLIAIVTPQHWHPSNALLMGHGGPLVSVSPRKLSVLSGSLLAALYSPPCLRTRKNEVTGGGDIHRYSMLPLFSGSIVVYGPPQRPGHASERKESLTARVLAVIRIMKCGDNCRHHLEGASIWC